jgi:hypothetical protein
MGCVAIDPILPKWRVVGRWLMLIVSVVGMVAALVAAVAGVVALFCS